MGRGCIRVRGTGEPWEGQRDRGAWEGQRDREAWEGQRDGGSWGIRVRDMY